MTRRTQKRIQEHIAALASSDKDVSAKAEHNLFRYYGARALEMLIEACDHENPQVRFRAVWLLGSAHDSRAFDTVLRLIGDPDGAVRYDAAIALGRLGDERAIPILIALMSIPDLETCVNDAAATGIVSLGKAAVPALTDLLQSDIPSVRRMTAYTLGNIGDEVAIIPLSELLKDKDPLTRMAGIDSLAEIGTSRCRDLIRQGLDDEAEEVRESAAYSLRELNKALESNSEAVSA